jgi:hypothetical protein
MAFLPVGCAALALIALVLLRIDLPKDDDDDVIFNNNNHNNNKIINADDRNNNTIPNGSVSNVSNEKTPLLV